jgi:hypothetical protein
MQILLIGEYEVTITPDQQPALVLHHLIRDVAVVSLNRSEAAAVAAWLLQPLRRIRELTDYRVIVGTAGDVTWYLQNGMRVAYLNVDQARTLADHLARALPESATLNTDLTP